jgi:uncharacterized protein YecE (DUF72 family)
MVRKDGLNIFVGCSGWSYKHWKGKFYPEDLSSRHWFGYYEQTFDTVEINNTFYQLPAEKTFEGWAAKAKEGFIYSVKASRYITHIKRLKETEEALPRLLERARLLKEHLGPILYQLPPNFDCNLERLERFLQLLPRDLIHVFEFRDQRWVNDAVFSLLERHKVSHCVHDMGGLQIPWKAVGPVVYVRFHGRNGKYGGNYPDHTLRKWAKWLETEASENKRDIYAYFNNDAEGYAVFNAQSLRKKLVG